MAQEEPEIKRFKHSIISEHIFSDDFKEKFSKHWRNFCDLKEDDLEIISKPFRICKISNFLCDENFMDGIKTELLDVKSRRNCIDLYQFEQTNDLSIVQSPHLRTLYDTFQIDLALWMEYNTKIRLSAKMSMSSSCYCDTDYLLCHDDNMGDRRIAFILYLSKNWTEEDGGALDLFDTDENGLPRNIVRSLVPEYNSLVFFEVVDNSYHQVAEVTSPDKSRWSISGWFHGPLRKIRRPPRPEIITKYLGPVNTEIDLAVWIKSCYLIPYVIKEIHQDVEEESYTFLSEFFKNEIYERLVTDIKSTMICWNRVGPPNMQNYEVADEETLPKLLKDFYNLFKSLSFFRLLKDYTELDLVPETEIMEPKMTIELQRWSRGCYTLICDKSDETVESQEKEVGTSDILNLSSSKASNESKTSDDPPPDDTDNNGENKNTSQSDCVSPASSKELEDIDEEEIMKRVIRKRRLAAKKKTNGSQQSSLDSTSPVKSVGVRDTDEEESDISDYLSEKDAAEQSEEENQNNEPAAPESGSLDVIMQFNTCNVPDEEMIDYVDPKEQDGALIHVPSKDNHLCLVYKTLSTCRVHKYVNHYCKGYFYNLMCTYYE